MNGRSIWWTLPLGLVLGGLIGIGVAATLSPGQEQILLKLECQLARACEEPVSPSWTETAMKQSDGLRQADVARPLRMAQAA